ncbi:hypothetical protein FQN50_002201 [Emmonsiellopsis sp. PD_5]|nr:hypothetical protein FQN50_002201 [Emmonsiellopsis sp. PD_5]
MSDTKSTAEEARDSLSSILSFYLSNRESIQNVPSWVVEAAETGSIKIALSPSLVPILSDDQVEVKKDDLRAQLRLNETMDNLTEEEKRLMIEAANTSRIKRKENKQGQT